MKRMKKCFSVLSAVVLLLSAAPLTGFVGLEISDFDFNLSADAATIVKSGSCGENLTWSLDSDGVLTVSGTGEMDDYSSDYSPWFPVYNQIKTVIIGNGVTSISAGAFSECYELTSVTIAASVASIGDFAFEYCSKLTSVTIPDSVTSIGDWAFCGCTSLTDITVDADNTAYCSENGVLFNKSKTELIQYPVGNARTSYTIPDSVTSIGWSAFCDCTKLTSVTIPDSVTSIGDDAFSGCTSLTSVTIPDSVTSIGSYAFHYCSKLTSVTIPDSVTSIGDCAFCGCTSLTDITVDADNTTYCSEDGVLFNKSKTELIQYPVGNARTSYTIPDSVTSIGYSAFCDCTKLTSVTIPDNVMSIGDWAFSGCTKLTSVTIPDSVTSIGSYAFYDCTKLTSVTIPDSVTSIGYAAFYYCNSLTDITVDADNTAYCSEDGVLFNKSKTKLIQYPVGNARTSYTIPDSVTSIGYAAFCNCTSLTSVTIPDSVTSIGDNAFSWCTKLTSVTIPDSVTSIGDDAFSWCTKLTSVTIPDSVTSIGSYAFYYCTSLTDITVDADNTAYCSEDGVLFNKSKTKLIQYPVGNARTSYTIPDSVTSIGEGAFAGCTKLTSVTIPDSVTSIGYAAFCDGTSLTSVTIFNPDCVIPEDDYVFSVDVLLRGYDGSTAEAYAVRNEQPFKAFSECSDEDSNGLCDDCALAMPPALKIGDVDGDKAITASDARLALRASVKLETLSPAQMKAADVDKEKGVSASDARLILRVAVKLDSFE